MADKFNKSLLQAIRKNVLWICLCLQSAAWLLDSLDISSGIYYVSEPFSLGKGQFAVFTLFLWIFWFLLLPFTAKTQRFLLILLCAAGTELKLLMFARALSEGYTQFAAGDLFSAGIAGCLYSFFGSNILKPVFWQSLYICGMNILENILLISCIYLPFHASFVLIKHLRTKNEQNDAVIRRADIGKKIFKIIYGQIFYICACIQTFCEPLPYLNSDMNLHLYPSGMNETSWIGGIFIFLWIILLAQLPLSKSFVLVFLCATGFSLFNDYPANRTFQYPQDETALNLDQFPIQNICNNYGNSILLYCNEKFTLLFTDIFGKLYEPIYSICFIFLVMYFILLIIRLIFRIIKK